MVKKFSNFKYKIKKNPDHKKKIDSNKLKKYKKCKSVKNKHN